MISKVQVGIGDIKRPSARPFYEGTFMAISSTEREVYEPFSMWGLSPYL